MSKPRSGGGGKAGGGMFLQALHQKNAERAAASAAPKQRDPPQESTPNSVSTTIEQVRMVESERALLDEAEDSFDANETRPTSSNSATTMEAAAITTATTPPPLPTSNLNSHSMKEISNQTAEEIVSHQELNHTHSLGGVLRRRTTIATTTSTTTSRRSTYDFDIVTRERAASQTNVDALYSGRAGKVALEFEFKNPLLHQPTQQQQQACFSPVPRTRDEMDAERSKIQSLQSTASHVVSQSFLLERRSTRSSSVFGSARNTIIIAAESLAASEEL